MKNKITFSTVLALIGLCLFLAACSRSSSPIMTADLPATAEKMAETLAAERLTEIAWQPTGETLPSTITSTSIATLTQIPTQQVTFSPTPPDDYQSPSGLCLHASLASETIPDDTFIQPNESFVKTWWLQNVGTCTWTEEYSVVFHHGTNMSATSRLSLGGYVAPGQSVAINLTMTAPSSQGSYIAFYNLESADGTSFGVGTSGQMNFWIRIIVPNPDPTPFWITFDIASRGQIRSDGEIAYKSEAGDTASTHSWQGFATFDLSTIPSNAVITGVIMDLDQGYSIQGDPFGGLGCLGVYHYDYGSLDPSDFFTGAPSGGLWSFCSEIALATYEFRIGSEAAIAAVQDSIYGGFLQFRFQFDIGTDGDSFVDLLTFTPRLGIEFFIP